MTEERLVIAPASLPQELALNSTSDITLYGGGLCASVQNLFNSVKP